LILLLLFPPTKACKDGECVDLSPSHVADNGLPGKLNGQHYVTWDIKVLSFFSVCMLMASSQ